MCRAVVSIACLLSLQTIFVPAHAAEESSKAPPEIKAISQAMSKFVESGEISGAVTLVARQGKIRHFSAVGLADMENKKPMKRSSRFFIASMTKPIVASALMILQDEGKLSVDDNVRKYLPEFADFTLADGSAAQRPVTIRDCLTHTAGLSGRQTFSGTLESAVDELAKRPLAFQPGERWQYIRV